MTVLRDHVDQLSHFKSKKMKTQRTEEDYLNKTAWYLQT